MKRTTDELGKFIPIERDALTPGFLVQPERYE
jgi:hypothetical protein